MPEFGPPDDLESLLGYVRQVRGFDFTGYKRTTLARRIRGRMEQIGVASYADYRHFLEADPREFKQLFNAILINLTGFFRDREAWEYLASNILSKVVQKRSGNEPIRAWCIGCASGEEAYTVAMLLAEQLSAVEDADREAVRIYGTDLDEQSLAKARAGAYTPAEVEPIPAALRERYLTWTNGSFVLRPEIRRSLIFGRHDLLRDSPISNLDLVVCRNTLMYFNAEAQMKAVSRLHFALRPEGIAFLGRAEVFLATVPLFEVVDLQHRIFRKRSDASQRWWSGASTGPARRALDNHDAARARDAAVRPGAAAQILLDGDGLLLAWNEEAQRLFALGSDDANRPIRELDLAQITPQFVERISRAAQEREVEWIESVTRPLTGRRTQVFDVLIVPLIDRAGAAIGTTVTYLDRTADYELRQRLERTDDELETVREELQSSNDEMEAITQELQSANAHLEAVNHELQATNRELHVANEDLQGTNADLRARTNELVEARSLLDSLLNVISVAVIAVDDELRILIWNRRAEALFGLTRSAMLGRHLFGLNARFPVEQLVAPLRVTMREKAHQLEMVPWRDGSGRRLLLRIVLAPLHLPGRDASGATLLIEAVPRESAEDAQTGPE